jgi:hypothetical protein
VHDVVHGLTELFHARLGQVDAACVDDFGGDGEAAAG